MYEFGPFRLDPVDRLLWRQHDLVQLPPKAIEMLLLFVESGGRVLSKEDLMTRLWPDTFVEEANLSHQVYKLRDALGADASYIETLARRGYRFAAPVKRRLEPATAVLAEREFVGAAATSAQAAPAHAVIAFPAAPPAPHVEHAEPQGAWRGAVPWAAVAVLTAVVIAQWVFFRQPPASTAPLQLTVELSPTVSVVPALGPSVVLSPDGSLLAFRGRTDPSASPQIFIRRLTQNDVMVLAGTEDVGEFFFSPDGAWIAFSTADRKLKKVPTGGGDVITLADVGQFRGGDWTRDGQIVYAMGPRYGLSKISDGGGNPVTVTTLDESAGEITHRFPQVLPDGRTVIYTSNTTSVNYDDASIMAQSLSGGTPKRILQGGYAARYVASGHLLYVHQDKLFAVPFDLDRLLTTGTPVAIIEHIAGAAGSAGAQFSVARDGTLVYLRGNGSDITTSLVMIDAAGRREPVRESGRYIAPRFSPDGRRLAVQISKEGRSSIWIYDFARNVMSRLTADSGADEVEPVWTSDGRRILFSSDRETRGKTTHLFSKQVDSSETPVRLTNTVRTEHEDLGSLLSDGKTLVFGAITDGWRGFELVKAASPSGGQYPQPEILVSDRMEQTTPMVSPDGRWLAYMSGETGRSEVFVRRFPELDGKEQISADGGSSPTWSPAASQLFFSSWDHQRIMVVDYAPHGSAFNASKPRVWAEAKLADFEKIRNFDVHPDGKRVVVVETPDQQAGPDRSHAVIYFNFLDELKRLAK